MIGFADPLFGKSAPAYDRLHKPYLNYAIFEAELG